VLVPCEGIRRVRVQRISALSTPEKTGREELLMRRFRLGRVQILAMRMTGPFQRHLEIRNQGLFFGRFNSYEVSIGHLLWIVNVYKK
jgi:hypothetical protein